MDFHHVSVLKDEVIEQLNIVPDGLYLDGTVGGGGHAYEIARRLKTGTLVAVDRDEEALEAARKKLAPFGDRVIFLKGNFRDIQKLLTPYGLFGFDGILLDIGVSSHQLDTASRGFSFRENGPLDMRMDVRAEKTAADVVATYAEEELVRIFRSYSEERYSGRIASAICQKRLEGPIETTEALSKIIVGSLPARAKKEGLKSIARIFQALRIEVNRELEALEEAIPEMMKLLKRGGRLAIITFHSLEDRRVKEAFRHEELECVCDPKAPVCTCSKRRTGRVITRKPIVPSEEEVKRNSRAHSAKLRVVEKV